MMCFILLLKANNILIQAKAQGRMGHESIKTNIEGKSSKANIKGYGSRES